jgi:hypothetical protein
MPYRELIEWETFLEEFGPVTLHERLDWSVAQLVYAQAVQGGYKGSVSDFVAEWETDEPKAHIVDWLSAVARKS